MAYEAVCETSRFVSALLRKLQWICHLITLGHCKRSKEHAWLRIWAVNPDYLYRGLLLLSMISCFTQVHFDISKSIDADPCRRRTAEVRCS